MELGLGRGSSKGVGVRSFARRCQPEGIAAYVGWIGRSKRRCNFLRSAAGPLASLLEKIRRSSLLVPLRFSGLSRSQNRGNRSDRLISLEGGVQSGVHGVGRFVMASVDATGGTLIGKTCPVRLSFGAIAELGYQGRGPCWIRKQIWPTLGK